MIWSRSPTDGGGADATAKTYPRFHSTAGDQFDTRGSDRFAAFRIKLRGAYTPAQPIIDRRMFAGRTKLLTQLIRAIEDERLHTVIYGERGLGKTSLLHVLAQTAREARYLVVYVTCGAGSNFNEMLRAVMETISLRFHADYGPTSPEAERGATFASLLGTEPITVRLGADMLAKVTGTRVLVVLDEFDRAESGEFRREIAEVIKSLSDRSVRVQFVVAGVAANLNELVENVPSIQRSIASMQVPKMTAAEVRELIKNGEPVTGITFDDGALHAIISRSLGFPYLASLLSHRSGLAAIDRSADTVTAKDVSAATSQAVDEALVRVGRNAQRQIQQRQDKGQLDVLGALAGAAHSTGGAFTPADVDTQHADPATVTAARALLDRLPADDPLIERLHDEFGGAFCFREESVPTYLWLLAAQGRPLDVTERAEPART